MRPAFAQRKPTTAERPPSAGAGAAYRETPAAARAPARAAESRQGGRFEARMDGRADARADARRSEGPRRAGPVSRESVVRRGDDFDDRYDTFDRKRRMDGSVAPDGPRKMVITHDHAMRAIVKYMMDQLSTMKAKVVDLTEELEQVKDRGAASSSSSSADASDVMLFVTVRESGGQEGSINLLSAPNKASKSTAVADPGSKLRVVGGTIPSDDGDGRLYVRVVDVSPTDGTIQYLYISVSDIEPGSYSTFP
jgi:hypothetical protein